MFIGIPLFWAHQRAWDFLYLCGVTPYASELCRAADRENGRQRQMLFDLIRSNPMINGFSLTSWGSGNEGTLEGLGVIKEGLAYAMQEGWAPFNFISHYGR